jgi:hypothetical protein
VNVKVGRCECHDKQHPTAVKVWEALFISRAASLVSLSKHRIIKRVFLPFLCCFVFVVVPVTSVI